MCVLALVLLARFVPFGGTYSVILCKNTISAICDFSIASNINKNDAIRKRDQFKKGAKFKTQNETKTGVHAELLYPRKEHTSNLILQKCA